MEISGIETAKVLDATIDEAHKQGVPFHQAISMVRGATLATRGQLKEFARIAHEARVEVIMTPGPRPSWYTGRQIATPEGALSGMRMRGMDSIRDYASSETLLGRGGPFGATVILNIKSQISK